MSEFKEYGTVRVPGRLIEKYEPVQPAAEPEAPPPASAADDVIERWFLDTFHNLSGLAADHFNHFRAAADRLKALLRAEEK